MDGSIAEGGKTIVPQETGIVQQAEIKQKEAVSAWSSLMDKMEASKETQGDFFLKLGQKTPGKDTRALILREPYVEGEQRIIVAITAYGPKAIKVDGGTGIDAFLKDQLVEGSPCGLTISGFVKGGSLRGLADKRDLLLVFSQDDMHKKFFNFERDLTDADRPMIDKAIADSIAKAESPHKAKVEESQKQIGLADSLSSRISQLPPKL